MPGIVGGCDCNPEAYITTFPHQPLMWHFGSLVRSETAGVAMSVGSRIHARSLWICLRHTKSHRDPQKRQKQLIPNFYTSNSVTAIQTPFAQARLKASSSSTSSAVCASSTSCCASISSCGSTSSCAQTAGGLRACCCWLWIEHQTCMRLG